MAASSRTCKHKSFLGREKKILTSLCLQVLREEGPEMHIKDLTTRILELGIVKSNCATSLETLLYRQTSGGSQAKGNSRGIVGPSKFTRVLGKHGWFGLKPHVLQEESDLNISNISLESIEDIFQDEKENRWVWLREVGVVV